MREISRGRRRIGGRLVRRAQNAVYSVRNRVFTFRNGSVRRRRRHREYMALRYRLVYVGAIAVLFRFVVMLLNRSEWEEGLGEEEKKEEGTGTWFVGRGQLWVRIVAVYGGVAFRRGVVRDSRGEPWMEKIERGRLVDDRERRKCMGQYRYTEGRKEVWLAGRVRRVSRRGAVVLTREEGGIVSKSKRQRVGEQLARDNEKAVSYSKLWD